MSSAAKHSKTDKTTPADGNLERTPVDESPLASQASRASQASQASETSQADTPERLPISSEGVDQSGDQLVESALGGEGMNTDDVIAEVTQAKKRRRERRSAQAALEWTRYRRTRSDESRDNLLNLYLPLVRSVAGRMAMGFPRSVELQDLINTGVIGLIEAFKNFDPDRGVKFETYAVPRIRGAILDELRALDWVPRSTRAKARSIDKATTSLENDFGRPPTEDELASKLEYTHTELMAALDDVSCSTVLSLDEVIFRDEDNRQVPRIESIEDKSDMSVLNAVLKKELQAFLRVAIGNLTEQEKLVIALYYFEELTLKEIGAVMTISESRVSQIHTKSVSKLRGLIQERFAAT
ncbi:MAG: FliA/WhiG family RNA polymerase sigma factor [Candidatus Zixiibacteriota bacterium]